MRASFTVSKISTFPNYVGFNLAAADAFGCAVQGAKVNKHVSVSRATMLLPSQPCWSWGALGPATASSFIVDDTAVPFTTIDLFYATKSEAELLNSLYVHVFNSENKLLTYAGPPELKSDPYVLKNLNTTALLQSSGSGSDPILFLRLQLSQPTIVKKIESTRGLLQAVALYINNPRDFTPLPAAIDLSNNPLGTTLNPELLQFTIKTTVAPREAFQGAYYTTTEPGVTISPSGQVTFSSPKEKSFTIQAYADPVHATSTLVKNTASAFYYLKALNALKGSLFSNENEKVISVERSTSSVVTFSGISDIPAEKAAWNFSRYGKKAATKVTIPSPSSMQFLDIMLTGLTEPTTLFVNLVTEATERPVGPSSLPALKYFVPFFPVNLPQLKYFTFSVSDGNFVITPVNPSSQQTQVLALRLEFLDIGNGSIEISCYDAVIQGIVPHENLKEKDLPPFEVTEPGTYSVEKRVQVEMCSGVKPPSEYAIFATADNFTASSRLLTFTRDKVKDITTQGWSYGSLGNQLGSEVGIIRFTIQNVSYIDLFILNTRAEFTIYTDVSDDTIVFVPPDNTRVEESTPTGSMLVWKAANELDFKQVTWMRLKFSKPITFLKMTSSEACIQAIAVYTSFSIPLPPAEPTFIPAPKQVVITTDSTIPVLRVSDMSAVWKETKLTRETIGIVTAEIEGSYEKYVSEPAFAPIVDTNVNISWSEQKYDFTSPAVGNVIFRLSKDTKVPFTVDLNNLTIDSSTPITLTENGMEFRATLTLTRTTVDMKYNHIPQKGPWGVFLNVSVLPPEASQITIPYASSYFWVRMFQNRILVSARKPNEPMPQNMLFMVQYNASPVCFSQVVFNTNKFSPSLLSSTCMYDATAYWTIPNLSYSTPDCCCFSSPFSAIVPAQKILTSTAYPVIREAVVSYPNPTTACNAATASQAKSSCPGTDCFNDQWLPPFANAYAFGVLKDVFNIVDTSTLPAQRIDNYVLPPSSTLALCKPGNKYGPYTTLKPTIPELDVTQWPTFATYTSDPSMVPLVNAVTQFLVVVTNMTKVVIKLKTVSKRSNWPDKSEEVNQEFTLQPNGGSATVDINYFLTALGVTLVFDEQTSISVRLDEIFETGVTLTPSVNVLDVQYVPLSDFLNLPYANADPSFNMTIQMKPLTKLINSLSQPVTVSNVGSIFANGDQSSMTKQTHVLPPGQYVEFETAMAPSVMIQAELSF